MPGRRIAAEFANFLIDHVPSDNQLCRLAPENLQSEIPNGPDCCYVRVVLRRISGTYDRCSVDLFGHGLAAAPDYSLNVHVGTSRMVLEGNSGAYHQNLDVVIDGKKY